MAPCSIVDATDSIFGIYMHIHPLYLHVKYLQALPSLVGIFVTDTYLVITCVVEFEVGSILVYIYVKMLDLYANVAIGHVRYIWNWQSYLFSDTCQICVQCFLLKGCCQ